MMDLWNIINDDDEITSKINIMFVFVTVDVSTVEVCIMCSELIHIKLCVSFLDNLLFHNSQTRN